MVSLEFFIDIKLPVRRMYESFISVPHWLK